MSCKKCQETKSPCFQAECGCTYKIDTDCINYSGEDLTCSSIPATTNLSEVLEGLDNYICDVKDMIGGMRIENVGNGAGTFQEVNIVGVREFRSLFSITPSLTIVENGDTVDFQIAAASETMQGIAEIATQSEVNIGTDSSRFITPSTLNGKTATETRRGVLEIATQAEADAGTDNTRAITPLRMATYVDTAINQIPSAGNATTSQRGIVELATNAEAQAGTDTERAIVPSSLASVTATQARRGLIELATQAEVTTGTDATRAITPATYRSDINTVTTNITNQYQSYTQNYVSNTSNLPTATTSARGVAELATNSEVQSGVDTTRIVTPAALSSRTATQTRSGLAEIATNAEVFAGTDGTRIVTPAGLNSLVASTTRRGLSEIATQAEVDSGVDNTRYVTPATLQTKLDNTSSALPLWGATGTFDVGASSSDGSIFGNQGIISTATGTRLGEHETSILVNLSKSVLGRKISANIFTNSNDSYRNSGVTSPTIRVVSSTQLVLTVRQTLDEVQAIRIEILAFPYTT